MKIKLTALLTASVLIFGCNNSKTDSNSTSSDSSKQAVTDQTATDKPIAPTVNPTASATKIFVDGKESDLGGSLLVQKDKDHLQAGNDYLVMLTAPNHAGHETLILNFLFALKTGSYPVVGMSYHRGESPNSQMFGGLLGGKPKLTDTKVNITECKDLGSNNMGGHKWSISGEFGELVIPAMSIMLMDKTKNHPKEIKVEKGSFSNLTFDDNWEDMMKKASEMMQKK